MPDMFGAAVGVEHGIHSEQALAETAMAPAKQRLIEAKAGLAEDQAAAQKRFAATAIDPRAGLWGVAAAAVNAGMPDAYKIANTASLIDYRRAEGDARQLRAAESVVRTRAALFDEQARLLTGVKDDASFQAALQDFERISGQSTGMLGPNGELKVPYSPELVGRMRARALSTKDSMLLDFRNRSLDSANRERESKQRNRDFWQNMDHQQEREAARRRGRGGEGSSLFPSGTQITIGADFIAEKFGVESKEPWTRVMGRELIENAKRLRSGNPALTSAEAIEQSFKELNNQGRFGAHRLANKKEALRNPIMLPYTEDGQPDKAKLIEGQVYKDDSGQLRQWNGVNWTTMGRIRSADERPYELSDRDARTALGLEPSDEEPDSSSDDDDEED